MWSLFDPISFSDICPTKLYRDWDSWSPSFQCWRNSSPSSSFQRNPSCESQRVYKKSPEVLDKGRSLVLDDYNRAVCFSPTKAMHSSQFLSLYPKKTDDIQAEEFIDGIMINVFWNPNSNLAGNWELSTRNTVGANILCGNSKKTYQILFKEALKEINLDLNILPRNFCYSFVLQSPTIPNTIPFTKTQLYLVEIYEIINTENGTICVFSQDREKIQKMDIWENTSIRFPEVFQDWENYNDIKDKYASMNAPHSCIGVILRNTRTWERSKFRNPVYEYIKFVELNLIYYINICH